jgi:hypothetical protein
VFFDLKDGFSFWEPYEVIDKEKKESLRSIFVISKFWKMREKV